MKTFLWGLTTFLLLSTFAAYSINEERMAQPSPIATTPDTHISSYEVL